ncbi:MAG: 2-oxoglutarate dehydrogenase complex dihydrolipoyllysine-residue succinyltransferase [Planctomycetes bacterium]|nr:2-oxoglutarate dehydrogenase complex dihydrolipoyllysine-residue succinyltransferase [Planctomycetota bacterium]NBY03675.1 2-oxoglutarate dehydrogenase complex dihydrolipoyllysine-residue succinyltransferase [Planctomycetota bacterium]
MITEIKVPSVGESISEGVLSKWFKKTGDPVKVNEPLFEVETEKATTEVVAPDAGVLTILIAEGEKVLIGAVVGKINKSAVGESSPASSATIPSTPVSSQTIPVGNVSNPAARHLAEKAGVELSAVTGSGKGSRILKEDVVAHIESQAKPSAIVPKDVRREVARETRQRMTPIRQRIAERLLHAQQSSAILTTFNEADMSAIMAFRGKYKESFQKKHGVGLGFMSFFVKAVIEGLKAFPAVNARIDNQDIVYHHFYDIGVAVSTDKGLMVPVLRNVDELTFAEIEKKIVELAVKAKENKIAVSDLQGGTFTITNGGTFGSMLSTPILNPPQSGILGMHAIQKRAVVVEDQIVIRPMMYIALSYDHRIIDGKEAVSFLVRVKECLENPERIFFSV